MLIVFLCTIFSLPNPTALLPSFAACKSGPQMFSVMIHFYKFLTSYWYFRVPENGGPQGRHVWAPPCYSICPIRNDNSDNTKQKCASQQKIKTFMGVLKVFLVVSAVIIINSTLLSHIHHYLAINKPCNICKQKKKWEQVPVAFNIQIMSHWHFK